MMSWVFHMALNNHHLLPKDTNSILHVDIGGSFIKTSLVDVLCKEVTPVHNPISTPLSPNSLVKTLLAHLQKCIPSAPSDTTIVLGVPGVSRNSIDSLWYLPHVDLLIDISPFFQFCSKNKLHFYVFNDCLALLLISSRLSKAQIKSLNIMVSLGTSLGIAYSTQDLCTSFELAHCTIPPIEYLSFYDLFTSTAVPLPSPRDLPLFRHVFNGNIARSVLLTDKPKFPLIYYYFHFLIRYILILTTSDGVLTQYPVCLHLYGQVFKDLPSTLKSTVFPFFCDSIPVSCGTINLKY